MDTDGVKYLVNAPCVVIGENKEKSVPCVDCLWNCEYCGWNPRERERRLKEGRWVHGKLIFERRKFNGS